MNYLITKYYYFKFIFIFNLIINIDFHQENRSRSSETKKQTYKNPVKVWFKNKIVCQYYYNIK